jgi:hypothetical protein
MFDVTVGLLEKNPQGNYQMIWAQKIDSLNGIRQMPKKKGYDFNLSFDEVLYLTKQPCKYCGIAPSTPLNGTSNRVYYYNGIDRVNNTLGYSISNCVTACYMCNTSKNNFDIVDWTKWIQRLYNHMNTSGMFND